jgi:hypothetical protein
MDERLVLAVSSDSYLTNVFVSNTASDWSRLKEIEDLPFPGFPDTSAAFSVGQRGVAGLRRFEGNQWTFSTDLSDWWSIPSLPNVSRGPGQ